MKQSQRKWPTFVWLEPLEAKWWVCLSRDTTCFCPWKELIALNHVSDIQFPLNMILNSPVMTDKTMQLVTIRYELHLLLIRSWFLLLVATPTDPVSLKLIFNWHFKFQPFVKSVTKQKITDIFNLVLRCRYWRIICRNSFNYMVF